MRTRLLTAAVLLVCGVATGQTLQGGADLNRGSKKLRFDYVAFRPAVWETEALHEKDNERPNRGGLIFVYFTNISEEPVHLRYYRCNGEDQSYWLLGDFLAWDRLYEGNIAPGEMGVLELNAVSERFKEGEPFDFSYVDSTWKPVGRTRGRLASDPLRVSCIRILPGLRDLEVHVRHTGDKSVEFAALGIVGKETEKVDWVGRSMSGPGQAIARVRLAEPLQPSELAVVKVSVKEGETLRSIYGHRRAFADVFPIGCWSWTEDTLGLLRRHHLDTVIDGGNPKSPFFEQYAARYGMRAMVSTGMPVAVDAVRGLGDHPAALCWALTDEPDWSVKADTILFVERTVRAYNKTLPTFLTLCRNVKFFEYATIADIPCMDHYSVTAPSSSVWPHPYGTRLEETGYYTRDLKEASEPKPIWVWSQAIAPWEERPKRPVPTSNELAAQLMFNLGRGAKGIIWFNFDKDVAERYPDVLEAMGRWGRVLRMVRGDLLAAEPIRAEMKAPEKVDVAALASWDKLLLAITNTDYEIDDEAYPFRTQKDVEVSVELPEWIRPEAALALDPEGVRPVALEVEEGRATVSAGDIEACRLIVLVNDPAAQAAYEAEHRQALEDEKREF